MLGVMSKYVYQRLKRVNETYEIVDDLDEVIPPGKSKIVVNVFAAKVGVAVLDDLNI